MENYTSTATRQINHAYLSTKERFEELRRGRTCGSLVQVPNVELYWNNKSGTLVVTASQEWCDFLMGKTTDVPEMISV